jgi:hypothetical protein
MKIVGTLGAAVIVYFLAFAVAREQYEMKQGAQATRNATNSITGAYPYPLEVITNDEINDKSRSIGFLVAGAFVMLVALASQSKEQE